VQQASDGPGLLEQFEANKDAIRLLIVDSQMPGWVPQEGITRIREAAAGVARIPIILLSGTPTADARTTDPDTVLLRKPFQMTELADAVAKSLHGGAAGSAAAVHASPSTLTP
jgi:DNA-binding response OmpR family regulator